MNYNDAEGLEFGAGNTKIDPAALSGKLQAPASLHDHLHIDGFQELPEGCKVSSAENHGVSFWAQTGRIDVLLSDGTVLLH
jgi:hypothetical protein